MILTIDIGNSNICFGVYEGKNALFTARAKTDPLRTETEYAVLLSQIFRLHQSDPAQLTGAAISSVVTPCSRPPSAMAPTWLPSVCVSVEKPSLSVIKR